MTSASSGSSSGTPNAVAAVRIVRASSVELSAAAATQTPTLRPATCRWRATTNPSPPLLPGPHSTLTATLSP